MSAAMAGTAAAGTFEAVCQASAQRLGSVEDELALELELELERRGLSSTATVAAAADATTIVTAAASLVVGRWSGHSLHCRYSHHHGTVRTASQRV